MITAIKASISQVGFFKENPIESSANADTAAPDDDEDVSHWAIYYFVYFIGYDSYNILIHNSCTVY